MHVIRLPYERVRYALCQADKGSWLNDAERLCINHGTQVQAIDLLRMDILELHTKHNQLLWIQLAFLFTATETIVGANLHL